MDRTILHSDLNSYFVSVECLGHPELQAVPVAVCGSEEDRHGIILAKNRLAQKSGVLTGESIFSAKQKCPGLIMLPPHFDRYLDFSDTVKKIYYRYTDQIEPFGIDECWLDVSGSLGIFGSGDTIADEIRGQIKKETGLTVSVGVSFTKTFAKLGSDMKKPDAVTVLSRENYKDRVWPLPVSALLGAGRATVEKLHSRGIRTIGSLAALPPEYPVSWLGKGGSVLWQAANGLDDGRVALLGQEREIQSIGNGLTTPRNLSDISSVQNLLSDLCEEVGFRLRMANMEAGGIVLGVRHADFSYSEFQRKLPAPLSSTRELFALASSLFSGNVRGNYAVRALTVRVIYLRPAGAPAQISFFSEPERERQNSKIDCLTDDLRRRYGKAVLLPARHFDGRKTAGRTVPAIRGL